MAKKFDALKNAIKSDLKATSPSPRFLEVLEGLKAVAAAITDSLPSKDGKATIEPGHSVSYGQQFNVVLNIKSRQFRDVLFRAYVPSGGYPVRLDFFGEDLAICESPGEFEEAVRTFVREHLGTRLAMLV